MLLRLCSHAGGDNTAGGLWPAGFDDWSHASAPLSIPKANFARAMFGMYLDPKSITDDVRKVWAEAILALAS